MTVGYICDPCLTRLVSAVGINMYSLPSCWISCSPCRRWAGVKGGVDKKDDEEEQEKKEEKKEKKPKQTAAGKALAERLAKQREEEERIKRLEVGHETKPSWRVSRFRERAYLSRSRVWGLVSSAMSRSRECGRGIIGRLWASWCPLEVP